MKPAGATAALWLEPETTSSGPAAIMELARGLPAPDALEPGSWLALARGRQQPQSWLRITRRPPTGPDLALRCSALLLRGYVEICADGDVAWGRAPASPGPT